ncbi:MAG: hypothetical protein BVN28_02015 [Nitrospira sp. ST-bin4]|nr:MAG: hypothetical protein BVN28_02015 [Nitrospira sp. ST-bin4]
MTTMAHHRLMDLERVVEMLNEQLHGLQKELHQAKSWSPTGQRRNTVLNLRRNRLFMSAICNQQIRPNTKEASRGTSRASR